MAVVDKWSLWWKEIVVSVNGGYWRWAVTEIKMRWKVFSWWKMTLAKLVCFSWGGAVGVPSCQDMLFSRVGHQTNFSFVEYSVKDTDNTIKPIHEKPIETFISHHWECCCALSLFHTPSSQWCQLFINLAWLVTLKFYSFHISSALLIGQWKQAKALASLELEIRGIIGRQSESGGKAPWKMLRFSLNQKMAVCHSLFDT